MALPNRTAAGKTDQLRGTDAAPFLSRNTIDTATARINIGNGRGPITIQSSSSSVP